MTTPDFYRDLENNQNLLTRTDTSNLPVDHGCYRSSRKKTPGFFKDETAGRIMYEFVALRAKSYAYDIERAVTIRAKGIRGHVIRNHLTFDDHKRCLFANDYDGDDDGSAETGAHAEKLIATECGRRVVDHIHLCASISAAPMVTLPPPPPQQQQFYMPYTPYRDNVSIRSFKHQINTIRTMKLALNRSDDKRYILPDRVHTLAHGHFKIIK